MRGEDRAKRQLDDNYEREVSAVAALDYLRAKISTIAAFAAAADDRVDALPAVPTSDPDRRRRCSELVELIVATHEAADAAVTYGEELAAAVMAGLRSRQ